MVYAASWMRVRIVVSTSICEITVNLFELRSGTADAAIRWLERTAAALDRTGLYFGAQPILGSSTAVDAFVYTKRRVRDDRDQRRESARETSLMDQAVAHLYEQPRDWEEREKRRWRQVIQRPALRLAVRGAPGNGKTFLTRDSAVLLARETARRIRQCEVPLLYTPVPFWLTASELASASGSDAQSLVVDACLRSLRRFDPNLPPPPREWLLAVAKSSQALIFVDALDQLTGDEARRFKEASPRLKDLPGRLIATCRTLHWDERRPWLGWGDVTEVELAPFERREQNAFARNFPPGIGASGLQQALAGNYPLRQACSSPLLLAFVCLLLAEGEDLSVASRVTVYAKVLRRLLSGEWRQVTPVWRGNDFLEERVFSFLESAAWAIFQEAPEANRFTLAQWERIGPEPVNGLLMALVGCGVIDSAGFNDLGERCWSFLHRTLLEFLAGRAMAKEPDWLIDAKKHLWYAPEWMEVLTFLAAHLSDATPLLEVVEREEEDIFHSMLYLSARLASAAHQVSDASVEKIATGVEALLEEPIAKKDYWWDVVEAVLIVSRDTPVGARVFADKTFKHIVRLARHFSPDVCSAAANWLGGSGDPRWLEELVKLAQDDEFSEHTASALERWGDQFTFEGLAMLGACRDEKRRHAFGIM